MLRALFLLVRFIEIEFTEAGSPRVEFENAAVNTTFKYRPPCAQVGLSMRVKQWE